MAQELPSGRLQGSARFFESDLVMGFGQLEHTVFPAVDRAGPVAVLIDQADVLEDVPLLVVRFEHQFVFVDLADLAFGGTAAQVAAAASQLVAAEIGLHRAGGHKAGLLGKEVKVLFRPPAKAVSSLAFDRFAEALDAEHHVDPQHVSIGKEIQPSGTPQTEVARKPASQAGVEPNPAGRHRTAWQRNR